MINDVPFLSEPDAKHSRDKVFVSSMNDGSLPWQDEDICFNWVAADFPFPHTHTNWELHIQLRGTLSHSANGFVHHLHPGDVCLIRPNDMHTLSRVDSGEILLVAFAISNDYLQAVTKTIYDGLYEELENAKNPPTFTLDKYTLDTFVAQMSSVQRYITEQKEHKRHNVIKTKLFFQELFLHFIQNWIGHRNSFPLWLESLLRDLNNSDNMFLLAPEEIAALTPYSSSRMSTIFKQFVGEPLSQYLNKLKMAYAANLLGS